MTADSEGEYAVVIERNVEAAMRDGTILRADIWRPDTEGKFPILIERTPYDKTGSSESKYGAGEYYAPRGYVTVIQDVRGRFASDGEYYPFRDDGDGEKQDGYDTVEWAAKQLRGGLVDKTVGDLAMVIGPVALRELGLGIHQVHMGRAAMLKKRNHRIRPRSEVWLLR